MSIIYDALKKVEQVTVAKRGTDVTTVQVVNRWYLLMVVACAGLFIGTYLLIVPRSAVEQPQQQRTAPPHVQKPVSTLSPGAQAALYKTGLFNSKTFELSGVFFSDGKGYAVINNRILKEGDMLNGVTVEKITLAGVQIKDRNRLITIPAAHADDQ